MFIPRREVRPSRTSRKVDLKASECRSEENEAITWYLAWDTNMNRGIFESRRGMCQIQEQIVSLKKCARDNREGRSRLQARCDSPRNHRDVSGKDIRFRRHSGNGASVRGRG